jgi:hypothetical protein
VTSRPDVDIDWIGRSVEAQVWPLSLVTRESAVPPVDSETATQSCTEVHESVANPVGVAGKGLDDHDVPPSVVSVNAAPLAVDVSVAHVSASTQVIDVGFTSPGGVNRDHWAPASCVTSTTRLPPTSPSA